MVTNSHRQRSSEKMFLVKTGGSVHQQTHLSLICKIKSVMVLNNEGYLERMLRARYPDTFGQENAPSFERQSVFQIAVTLLANQVRERWGGLAEEYEGWARALGIGTVIAVVAVVGYQWGVRRIQRASEERAAQGKARRGRRQN